MSITEFLVCFSQLFSIYDSLNLRTCKTTFKCAIRITNTIHLYIFNTNTEMQIVLSKLKKKTVLITKIWKSSVGFFYITNMMIAVILSSSLTFELAEDETYHKQIILCLCFLIWRVLSAFQWNVDWCCKGFLLAKI